MVTWQVVNKATEAIVVMTLIVVIVWYAQARKIRQLRNWNAFPNRFTVLNKYRTFSGRLNKKPFFEILR